MLKTSALLFLLLVMLNVSAQQLSKDFKISISKPYRVVDAKDKMYFSDNNGFSYSVKTTEDKIVVQKFDVQNMKEVSRNEYEDTPPYHKAIEVVQIKERFYYLYESINKEADTKSVYAREFLTSDCSLSKERILFTSKGDVAKGSPTEVLGNWGLKGGPSFTVHKSYDNSKIMITYRRKPLSKRDAVNHDLLGFFVFDSSFELVWGKEVKMPYTEKDMSNIAYTVSANGIVYMMSLYREKKIFQLLTIPEVGELKVNDVEGGNFMFKDLYMKENKDGNIDFLGFYAKKQNLKYREGRIETFGFNTNGIRYFELSKTGEVLKSKNIEFPIELINQYSSGRQKRKNENKEENGKAGIRDVKLREFTVNSDGSVFILGEQYYRMTRPNGQYGSIESYYYQDLIATKLDAEGEVVWMKKLPKRQSGSSGRGGMGIAYFENDESHYILFLDNVKNANIGKDEVPKKHGDGQGGFLTAYKIDDATGDYTKHTLYNSLEVKGIKTYQFRTSRILEALDDVLLVEVYAKNKEDKMIKMELVK